MTEQASTPSIPRFWPSLGKSYAACFGLALAAPLFFAIPVVAEFVQHVAEHQIGMYDSLEAAQALENHPVRTGFGYVKIFALTLAALWVPLYLAAGRRRFGPISRSSLLGFVKVLAFALVVTGVTIGAGIYMRQQGASEVAILVAMVIGMIVATIIEILVAPWKVAAVIGDRRVGFFRSIKLAMPLVPWGFALWLLAQMPMMILHYALGAMMLFSEGPAMFWALAVGDSLVVGLLTTLLVAPGYFIYRRALIRKGEDPIGAP